MKEYSRLKKKYVVIDEFGVCIENEFEVCVKMIPWEEITHISSTSVKSEKEKITFLLPTPKKITFFNYLKDKLKEKEPDKYNQYLDYSAKEFKRAIFVGFPFFVFIIPNIIGGVGLLGTYLWLYFIRGVPVDKLYEIFNDTAIDQGFAGKLLRISILSLVLIIILWVLYFCHFKKKMNQRS